jgi:hypothetical protein
MSVEALPYGKRIIPIVPRAPPIPQLPRLRESCNLRHVPSVVMGQEGARHAAAEHLALPTQAALVVKLHSQQ